MDATRHLAMRAISFALVLSVSASAHAPEPAPESLGDVAKRVAKSLFAAKWETFRKDAGPAIVVEERWTGYDQFFDKKEFPFSGEAGVLGEHEFRAVAFFTTVPNRAKLSSAHAKVFRAFCKVVKESRKYSSPSWTWPSVDIDGADAGLDHYKVVGPCAGGTIASNVKWVAEFEKNSGRWRVRRLILGGH